MNVTQATINLFKLSTILFCIFFLSINNVYAQQNIITVPSSDILPADNMMLKTTVKSRINKGKYTQITPTATVGVGHGINLSIGVPIKINQDWNTQASSEIGIKKVWFAGSTTRITAGGSVTPYYTVRTTPDFFLYSHVSQKIKKTKTNITFGGYFYGSKHFLNKGGVIMGLDQVIIPNKVNLVADWMSSKNNKGNFAVGLKYKPNPTLSVSGAIIIPNDKSENIAFQVSVSKYIKFNKKDKKERI